jgi:enamine deaminase RidA (YjgF/YER057c/UK114 family)
MGTAEDKLAELGIRLPTKIARGKGIVPVRRYGDLLFVSGHGPTNNEGELLYQGQVGRDLSVDDAYLAARAAGIQLLRSIRDHVGDLDHLSAILKALAFVNSAPDFFDQAAVAHGFSDLMVDVFGERGLHARSAIGVSSLPRNYPVEIEMIVALRN